MGGEGGDVVHIFGQKEKAENVVTPGASPPQRASFMPKLKLKPERPKSPMEIAIEAGTRLAEAEALHDTEPEKSQIPDEAYNAACWAFRDACAGLTKSQIETAWNIGNNIFHGPDDPGSAA